MHHSARAITGRLAAIAVGNHAWFIVVHRDETPLFHRQPPKYATPEFKGAPLLRSAWMGTSERLSPRDGRLADRSVPESRNREPTPGSGWPAGPAPRRVTQW